MLSYIDFLKTYAPRFIDGAIITLEQAALAAVLAIVVAVIAAFMKMSTILPLRWAGVAYMEIFRGTSLLVQMYWIFFVLPLFDITLSKFTAGFIAVGLNLGAYGAELVRSGVQSVPKGQYEACLALNISYFKRIRRVIFPQALVALISVADLMFPNRSTRRPSCLLRPLEPH